MYEVGVFRLLWSFRIFLKTKYPVWKHLTYWRIIAYNSDCVKKISSETHYDNRVYLKALFMETVGFWTMI